MLSRIVCLSIPFQRGSGLDNGLRSELILKRITRTRVVIDQIFFLGVAFVYMTLEQTVEALRQHQLVALPTETVYGLGALATSEAAIQKVYEVKARPRDNPLICHFFDLAQITPFVEAPPVYWPHLVRAFSPGPVSYRLRLVPDSPLAPAVAGQDTVVVRIPDQPMCLEVLRQLQAPVAAPSANTSGKVSPTTASMVELDLGSRIAGVLDGGPCHYGLESTILDCCEDTHITILRPGAVGPDELRQVLVGCGMERVEVSYAEGAQVHVVPGSKYRHYAPDVKLVRVERVEDLPLGRCVVLMSREQHSARRWSDEVTPVLLGARTELPEVARSLYQTLKSLDRYVGEKVYYLQEDWGMSSLGRAIHNRLVRASAPA